MTCLGESYGADTYGAGGALCGPVPLCLSVSGASHRVLISDSAIIGAARSLCQMTLGPPLALAH